MNSNGGSAVTIRPLTAGDLDGCVAIDRKATGNVRKGFFEKRLNAALQEPKQFIYVGCEDGSDLAGFALARVVAGEFGRDEQIVVFDAMGVDPDAQGHGIGHALIEGIETVMRQKGISDMHSQVPWSNTGLLHFLNSAGFELAPRVVLERGTEERIITSYDDEEADDGVDPAEMDFSAPEGDDFTALSHDRVPVRSMRADDLDAIIRIDTRETGGDHSEYLAAKMKEALTESGVRVSVIAEQEGHPAGYIMARVDFGEFGRTDAVAVMDTIGVDPGYRHHGVGSALMSQLIANLATLRVEKIRTEVDWNGFEIMTYLDRIGFRPAQQVTLKRTIA